MPSFCFTKNDTLVSLKEVYDLIDNEYPDASDQDMVRLILQYACFMGKSLDQVKEQTKSEGNLQLSNFISVLIDNDYELGNSFRV